MFELGHILEKPMCEARCFHGKAAKQGRFLPSDESLKVDLGGDGGLSLARKKGARSPKLNLLHDGNLG